jgi:hypothetical protein
VRKFLDLALRGTERSFELPHSAYARDEVRNPEIVDFVLKANIVVERNPAELEAFKTLLSKSPGIGVGTFVGYHPAGPNPELMIFTVPLGIIIVSSAIGIGKAFEKGLNKKVEGLFGERRRRR